MSSKNKSLKNKIKKFGKTEYSKDKEYLNAVITSNINFVPQHKSLYKPFKMMMWFYALLILIITSLSLGLLAFSDNFVSSHRTIISIIEAVVFVVLIADVALRWYTSEVRIRKGNWSYFLFPLTITGIILIISLLPSLYLINVWTGKHYQIFNYFENMKFLRIFRIILLANLVPGVQIFTKVLSKEKSVLYVVFSIVIITIILFALVMFNIEQGVDAAGLKPGDVGYDKNTVQFHNFWDSLYFSTITLTTIGFGDKSPHTDMGRTITMIMSIIGIAVLATPSGVIAGGFITEIKETRKRKEKIFGSTLGKKNIRKKK